MLVGLLLSLLSQIPCTPAENTVVCGCKQANASACSALGEVNPELAKEILRALAMAKAAQEAGKAREPAASVDTGCPQSPNDNKCAGQEHHVISHRIAAALAKHKTLSSLYQPRDPRFVARASDLKAHCGYQGWHRSIDEEVTKWLAGNKEATAKQFEAFLRELYARPEMRARFPTGF
jgi:hypothetical protein